MRKLIENKIFLEKIKALINPTEDMSQRELSIALNKIVKKLNINNTFDIPYLAGYSKDAKTIYIDRRIPKFLKDGKKQFNIHHYLILHEITEKALIDHLGYLHYQLAHEIASRAEYAAILGEGFSFRQYTAFIQEKLAEIREERNYFIPSDLDLKPYLDSKDKSLIKKIQQSIKIKWVTDKNAQLQLNSHPTVISQLIKKKGRFPNNANLPLIVYQQALMLNDSSISEVRKLLKNNGWHNIWINGMYDYDHYHSNTHEALVVFSGRCVVQVGGPKGIRLTIKVGDVIIFPAGVSHKKIEASADFKSIGCYPFPIDYDMNTGKAKEHPSVDQNIKKVKLPKTDPIFGKKGPLLRYWAAKKG